MSEIAIRQGSTVDSKELAIFGANSFRAAFAAASHPDDIDSYVRQAFSQTRIESELQDPASTFLLVERKMELKIFGRLYPLLARVEILNGFSAHADANDFIKAFTPLASKLKGAFVVHGEGPQPVAMQKILNEAGCKNVHVPAQGDVFEL